MRKAVDLLVEHAKPNPRRPGRSSREALDTGAEDAGAASASGEIWTSGS